jgi:GNAT superfamily N-acetyltransferase
MDEPAASGIQIKLVGPDDAAALTELFLAIDRHYWGTAPTLTAMAEHVRQRVLSATSCQIALAEIEGKAVGLATFAILYPAPGPSGQLFMKDLFTLAAARDRGVGHALMAYLARLALERGCGRFDWTAETDNAEALAFYDRLGARRVQEKVYFRFDGEALKALAAKD